MLVGRERDKTETDLEREGGREAGREGGRGGKRQGGKERDHKAEGHRLTMAQSEYYQFRLSLPTRRQEQARY